MDLSSPMSVQKLRPREEKCRVQFHIVNCNRKRTRIRIETRASFPDLVWYIYDVNSLGYTFPFHIQKMWNLGSSSVKSPPDVIISAVKPTRPSFLFMFFFFFPAVSSLTRPLAWRAQAWAPSTALKARTSLVCWCAGLALPAWALPSLITNKPLTIPAKKIDDTFSVFTVG